ncbi:hypothetical protein ACFL4W_00470 [Planctomycetota bacterium]
MTKAWKEGLSKTSIGRFGAYRDDSIPYNSGYLTCSATATKVFAEQGYDHRVELGWYQIPRNFRQKTQTTWTGNTYSFSFADGKPHSTVTRSLLFPGFHHRVRTGKFEYYWRIKNGGPKYMALPFITGTQIGDPVKGYDLKRDGKLAKPWVLLWFSGSFMPFDYPVLFTFDKQPQSIEIYSHEYIKIHFKTKAANVVQVHPFGARRFEHEETLAWKNGLPEGTEEQLDFWARAALAYPAQCKEFFMIDDKTGTVRIKNEFSYIECASQWKLKPLYLAPLPPVLANAREFRYPVTIKGKLRPMICPTFMGYYEAVEGKVLEYSLPLSRYHNHTLSPVRIVNDPAADKIQADLETYMSSGSYLTFGGDDHYEADCSLDSLHDLRIMAWALWSLPPDQRAKTLGLLTRGLKDFGKQDYLEFTTPITGTKSVRHKTIFDYYGVIDYDTEWYNGMNLAGLWAYDYFSEGDTALKFAGKHWPLIKKIFAYYEAYTDWAHLVGWTSARGEATWLDGINYAYEGVLGYAALARKLGKKEDAARGDCIAAKMEVFMFNCWQAGPYYKHYFPQAEDIEPMVASGYHEGRPAAYGDGSQWSCGNYAYCVREIPLLLKDLGKEEAIRRAMEKFRQNFPDWKLDPYNYGKLGYPGSDARRTVHHYFLDPRLIISALILGERVESLTRTGVPVTAPVLESLLVSLAPLTLVPRDADFKGTVWDAASRTLTVRLAGKGTTTVMLAHSAKPREVMGPVEKTEEAEGRLIYTVKLSADTQITFKF